MIVQFLLFVEPLPKVSSPANEKRHLLAHERLNFWGKKKDQAIPDKIAFYCSPFGAETVEHFKSKVLLSNIQLIETDYRVGASFCPHWEPCENTRLSSLVVV
jgi:hypothetical protein